MNCWIDACGGTVEEKIAMLELLAESCNDDEARKQLKKDIETIVDEQIILGDD